MNFKDTSTERPRFVKERNINWNGTKMFFEFLCNLLLQLNLIDKLVCHIVANSYTKNQIPNSIPLKDFIYSETYVLLTSVWILWYTMVKKNLIFFVICWTICLSRKNARRSIERNQKIMHYYCISWLLTKSRFAWDFQSGTKADRSERS